MERLENLTGMEKVVSMEKEAGSEVFFVDKKEAGYKLVHMCEGWEEEIALGIKSSTGDTLHLDFENVDEFAFLSNTRPVLFDKAKGIRQDLTLKKTYSFQADDASGQPLINTDRFVLRLAGGDSGMEDDLNNYILVSYHDKSLKVESINTSIDRIQVYNPAGQNVFESMADGHVFREYLPLPAGVYVVRVINEKSGSRVARILVP